MTDPRDMYQIQCQKCLELYDPTKTQASQSEGWRAACQRADELWEHLQAALKDRRTRLNRDLPDLPSKDEGPERGSRSSPKVQRSHPPPRTRRRAPEYAGHPEYAHHVRIL